jgi:hypothetical protein
VFNLNNQGRASAFASDDQAPSGLETNPEQMVSAARFKGLVAANSTANGDENDSASNMKGSDLGMAAITNGRKSV